MATDISCSLMGDEEKGAEHTGLSVNDGDFRPKFCPKSHVTKRMICLRVEVDGPGTANVTCSRYRRRGGVPNVTANIPGTVIPQI